MNSISNNEKLMIVLSKMYRTFDEKMSKNIKDLGLHPTEFAILGDLTQKGPKPLQQLGKVGFITSGTITYVVDKLEEMGYLKREKCDKDRRIIYAIITEEGKKVWDKAHTEHLEYLNYVFEDLGEQDLEDMIRLTKKIGKSVATK